MDNDDPYEINDWTFPMVNMMDDAAEINDFIDEDDVFEEDIMDNETNNLTKKDKKPVEETVQPPINNEIEQLKLEYERKILIVNKLLEKIENPVTQINDELVDIIQTIIKNITKKIIYKELSVDHQIMINIINELKNLIQSPNGVIDVYVSQTDYERLEAQNNSTLQLLNSSNSLSDGDVIIKSNSSKIKAVLTERIDKLMSTQHE